MNGAVGLLSSGNWHVCQTAVETVLAGGVLRPMQGVLAPPATTMVMFDESSSAGRWTAPNRQYYPSSFFPKQDQANFRASASVPNRRGGNTSAIERLRREHTISLSSEESVMTTSFGIGDRKERKLLNLFV